MDTIMMATLCVLNIQEEKEVEGVGGSKEDTKAEAADQAVEEEEVPSDPRGDPITGSSCRVWIFVLLCEVMSLLVPFKAAFIGTQDYLRQGAGKI